MNNPMTLPPQSRLRQAATCAKHLADHLTDLADGTDSKQLTTPFDKILLLADLFGARLNVVEPAQTYHLVDQGDFCRGCRGRGYQGDDPCGDCEGTGMRTVRVAPVIGSEQYEMEAEC